MKLEDNNKDNIKNIVIYANNEESSPLYIYNHNNEFNQRRKFLTQNYKENILNYFKIFDNNNEMDID